MTGSAVNRYFFLEAILGIGLSILLAGCEKKATAENGTGPAPIVVQPDLDANNFKVDHPEQFPLATAGERVAAPELNVTGVVSPDVSRQVPVPSLATGRIVEIDAQLGDEVKKGQLLFKVRSSDIANAFSNYRLAAKNEELTKIQLDRANVLFEHGAISSRLAFAPKRVNSSFATSRIRSRFRCASARGCLSVDSRAFVAIKKILATGDCLR